VIAAVVPNRVLVADDDEAMRMSVAAILRNGGYVITEAADGVAALAALAEHPVDVLVLDLRMPNKGGEQVLEELADPPVVVVVSAYAPEEQFLERVGDKIFKYLRKPVPPARLLAAVEEALGHSASGGT
jgi:two-component system, OmpR family, response regulator